MGRRRRGDIQAIQVPNNNSAGTFTVTVSGFGTTAVNIPFNAAGNPAESGPTPDVQSALQGISGTLAGLLSGFLGVGGGILMTPTFRGWLKLPLKDTVATSLACVGLIAIPSSITHIVEGTVNWTYALPLCIGVIPGARLGAKFAIAASDRHLRLVIAWGLSTIGLGYGISELIALVN